MFSKFDFSVLDTPDFKEDAVREEIIAPIVKRLGYNPSGPLRVMRSKPLIHPFVMIGSKRHAVNIIPDYTLFAGEQALAVIEAKGPKKSIVTSHHVEQAYSYAIHPEVRVKNYALCNGRELVVYLTDQWEPILQIPIPDIEKHWNRVEEALHPRFLQNPEFRGFAPDYGLAMFKAGIKRETIQIFILHHLQDLNRVTDQLYTGCTNTLCGEVEYIVTLDFSLEMYEELLSRLPAVIVNDIRNSLGQAPFRVNIGGKVILTCSGYLDEVTKGAYEDFVPIRVSSIEDVQYDASVILTPYNKVTPV